LETTDLDDYSATISRRFIVDLFGDKEYAKNEMQKEENSSLTSDYNSVSFFISILNRIGRHVREEISSMKAVFNEYEKIPLQVLLLGVSYQV